MSSYSGRDVTLHGDDQGLALGRILKEGENVRQSDTLERKGRTGHFPQRVSDCLGYLLAPSSAVNKLAHPKLFKNAPYVQRVG